MAQTPAKPAEKSDSVNVTYRPGKEDPVETTTHGYKFVANVATPVKKPEVVELLKNNPWFEVEGFKRAGSGNDGGKPKTPDEYRAHAVAWIRDAKSSAELQRRWDGEEGLRVECGVGTDDLDYLQQFFNPRLEQLKKSEAG